MFEDFLELLSAFNAHNVKYLIVGGYAVSFHAQPRVTKDIDILILPEAENAKAVYEALASFGAPLEGISIADFSDRKKFFRIGREPMAVDVLPEIEGVEFDRAWARRVEAVIDDRRGIKAFFISKDDLVASKLASGRPQDMADVAAIREAQENRHE